MPASTSASAAKPASSAVVNRRLAIESPTIDDIVATCEIAADGSSERTMARSGVVSCDGLPFVRRTRVIESGATYALCADCEYGKYIVSGLSCWIPRERTSCATPTIVTHGHLS